MKELFTIGDLSKLFQVKISTLRYYDDIGLLKPEYVDEKIIIGIIQLNILKD